jgi:O-antigen/teichoic acid export membrane protein
MMPRTRVRGLRHASGIGPDGISPASKATSEPSGSSARAARSLTAVSVASLASGLVTGPLVAHALGVTGRGILASVMVPIGAAPYIAQLGLGLFTVRAAARGISVSRLVGSVAVPLLVIGGAVAIAAGPLAAALVPVNTGARFWLRVGLMLLPVGLLANVLADIVWGQRRWGSVIALRMISPVGLVTIMPILYFTGSLTVATAAGVSIGVGLLPLPLLLAVLPEARRPRPDLALMREALSFGFRAWPGALADLANQRLDQLMMIPLVPPRELGLYAVATTVAVVGTAPAAAIAAVIFPRIAAGELHVLGPSFRITGLSLLVTQSGVGLIAPSLIPIAFGSGFRGAVPLVLILLPAWMLTALAPILAHALAGSGYPGPGSVAQMLGAALTVVGLVISLPTLGATGAAITSLISAAVALGYLLRSTRKHMGIAVMDLITPQGSDVTLAGAALRAALHARSRA